MQDIPDLTEIREAAERSPDYAAKLAVTMNEQAFGLYLSGSLRHSAMQGFGHDTCKVYFDNLVQSIFPGVDLAGVDPLLQMQIEQTVMLHHTIGVLYTEGTSKQPVEVRKVVLSLVVQLLTEFRRLSVVVREELATLTTTNSVDVPAPQLKVQGRLKRRPTSKGTEKEVA